MVDIDVFNKISNIEDDKERLKSAILLSKQGIVFDVLELSLCFIDIKHYYQLFIKINRNRPRLINELNNNFNGIDLKSF